MSQRPERAEESGDRPDTVVPTGRSAAPVVTRPDSESEDGVELGHELGEPPRDSTPLSERSESQVDALEPTTDE